VSTVRRGSAGDGSFVVEFFDVRDAARISAEYAKGTGGKTENSAGAPARFAKLGPLCKSSTTFAGGPRTHVAGVRSVLINGLPNGLCSAKCLEAVLEQAGLEAAIQFIGKAKEALEKFYKDNGLLQTGSSRSAVAQPADIIVEAGKEPPPPPAIVVEEYTGHKGNKNIQGILADIQGDVESDLGELNDNEKKSKKDFEDTKKDIEDSIDDKMKYKTDLEDQIADKLDDISTANQEKLGEKDTLDATIQALKAIEPSCNYVFTTFETRIKNREVEAEGVDDAIKALGGDPKEVEYKEAGGK